MASVALALLLAACTGPEPVPARGPQLLAVDLDAGTADAPLALPLRVEVAPASALEVVAVDGDHQVTWALDAAAAHELVLLGLRAGGAYRVTVRAVDDAGRVDAEVLEVEVPAAPDWFPHLQVLAHDPGRAEPGYTLLSCRLSGDFPDDQDLALVVDAQGHVVYWFDEGHHMMDARPTATGWTVIAGEPSAELFEVDWTGTEQRRYHSGAWGGLGTTIDAPGRFHHDWWPLDDGGGLVLSKEDRVVDYPTAYDTPDVLAPQLVTQDVVVRFDATGDVVWQVGLGDVLDPARIGFDTLDPARDDLGLDWSHANALVLLPDDGVLVSLRNQDALVKVTPDGQLAWILGNPWGWTGEQAAARLQPVGSVQWPYHQHGPAWDDGRLAVFDNGDLGASPGEVLVADLPPDTALESRVVVYEVDEAAGTVAEVASYDRPGGVRVFSDVVGDADLLPSGNVLGTFGAIFLEDGVPNASRGLAKRSLRVVEWDDTGAEVWHLNGTLPLDVHPIGWNTYRAERFAGFYDDRVTVTVTVPD